MPKYTAGIMINFEQSVVMALDKIAKSRKISRSALIREYVAEGLQREDLGED